MLFGQLLKLACQFQQCEVRHLIVVVSGEIIVLSTAHAHLVLQHLGHRGYAFAITLARNLIYVFGQEVVVALLTEVALVVGQVVQGVGILGLHALQGVFIRQLGVVNVYLCLSYLRTLLETIKHGDAQRDAYAVRLIPVVRLARVEPVFKVVGKGRIGSVACEGQ